VFLLYTSWKMNKTLAEARAYVARLREAALPGPEIAELAILPPFTALAAVGEALAGLPVRLGAQNAMWLDDGAFTGEISPSMLADVGCTIVELGHSERRLLFGETDARINAKVHAALRHGLEPLVCVGESAEERALGAPLETVLRQARMALSGVAPENLARCKLAYEPVWAIGEGGTPASPAVVAEVHAALKRAFPSVPVLYGGGANLENAAPLSALAEVDGLFIGRAAWQADDYLAIIDRALNARPRHGARPAGMR
jgi:triosephosphate isomerase